MRNGVRQLKRQRGVQAHLATPQLGDRFPLDRTMLTTNAGWWRPELAEPVQAQGGGGAKYVTTYAPTVDSRGCP